MRTGTKLPKLKALVFIVIAALFFLGLIELFQIRFKSGDIYPVYSSMRTDPLGTKAFYDALGSMQKLSVVRNYKPLPKLDPASTLFLFGVNYSEIMFMDEEEVKMLESFVSGGGRLVITFVPAADEPYLFKNQDKKENKESIEKDENQQNSETKKADEKKPVDDKSSPYKKKSVSLYQRWGLDITFDKSAKVSVSKGLPTLLATNEYALPPSIAWHSIAFLEKLGEGWTPIYKIADKSVLIEKHYGKGSIVFATDTYFASNEAVLKERHADLLAWLAGPHKKIIFDETHNGISENPGLTSLLLKYRLHGVFAAFLLMAALFVWQNSSSLVPQRKEEDEEMNSASGKDYLSGLTCLLQRNIPKREILDICVREWKKGARRTRLAKEDIQRIEKAAEAFKENSVAAELQVNAYRYITKILSKRTLNENRDRTS